MAMRSYTVKGGRLNVRERADRCSPVVRILDNGSSVGVYSISGGWARVRGGYCVAAYLEPKGDG